MPILAAESNSNAANIAGMLKPWPDSARPDRNRRVRSRPAPQKRCNCGQENIPVISRCALIWRFGSFLRRFLGSFLRPSLRSFRGPQIQADALVDKLQGVGLAEINIPAHHAGVRHLGEKTRDPRV